MNREKIIEILKSWKDRELADLILSYYEFMKDIPHAIGIQQVLEELQQVKDVLGSRKFKKFVESGSDGGASLWLYVNLFCDKNTQIFVIDPILHALLSFIIDKLREKGFNITFIQMESAAPEAVSGVGKDIGLFHSDSDHAYDSVRLEWELFSPLMQDGGIYLIHDTLLHFGPVEYRKYLEKNNFDTTTFAGETSLINIDPGYKCAPAGITMVRIKK